MKVVVADFKLNLEKNFKNLSRKKLLYLKKWIFLALRLKNFLYIRKWNFQAPKNFLYFLYLLTSYFLIF